LAAGVIACTAILGATGVPTPVDGGAADAAAESASSSTTTVRRDAGFHDTGHDTSAKDARAQDGTMLSHHDAGHDVAADTGTPEAGPDGSTCTPGATRCLGSATEACTDAGSWANLADACASTCTPYDQIVMCDSPIAYWRLDETAGPTAHDVRDAYNGTYVGQVTFSTDGAVGGSTSVFLNSSDSPHQGYVSVDTPAGSPLAFVGTAPFTLEVWAKPTAIRGDNTLLSNVTTVDAHKEGYTLYIGTPHEAGVDFSRFNDGTEYIARDASVVMVTDPPSWYYLVATYDGDQTMKVYVNGNLIATNVSSAPIVPFACSFNIGASQCGATSYYQGYVDEVAVYDKALSQDRVSAHFGAR
jgi:hypothetical protein